MNRALVMRSCILESKLSKGGHSRTNGPASVRYYPFLQAWKNNSKIISGKIGTWGLFVQNYGRNYGHDSMAAMTMTHADDDGPRLECDQINETIHIPEHWERHLNQLKTGEKRALRKYFPSLKRINELEQPMQACSDEELQSYAAQLRKRAQITNDLLELLPEAFALARESCWRVLGLRHYDVQILGGMVLAEGQVAEMRTGEGKTLVAILPAFLYSLNGKGVHIVTVNDYLAQRDASWVGKALKFLGVSVGIATSTCSDFERQKAFSADVTYVTAHALSFAFLYDHMTPSGTSVSIKRPLNYAIVDEVDSILIDEARNPFIINAPYDFGIDETSAWRTAVFIAKNLKPPPVFNGPPPEHANKGMIWVEKTEDDVVLESFDFLMDTSFMSANLTKLGMRTVLRRLMELDLLKFAQSRNSKSSATIITESEGNGRNVSDPSGVLDVEKRQQPLFAVLVNTMEDGKIQAILRFVEEPGSSLNFSALKIPLLDKTGSILQYEQYVRVDCMEFLEQVLHEQFGLKVMSNDTITSWHLDIAAPSVLWTGAISWGNYITQAIRAEWIFQKNVHYLVKNGNVTIIDIASGRERERSRWQSGLHQAVEAKEQRMDPAVKISKPSYDRQRTTYQSLFNCYRYLSGMTGTASIESAEFEESYGLQVIRVPPHKPSRRVDLPTEIFPSRLGWTQRIQKLVQRAYRDSRPVLLAASSVEESETIKNIIAGVVSPGGKSFQFEEQELKDFRTALDMLPSKLPIPDLKDLRPYKDSSLDASIKIYDQFQSSFAECVRFSFYVASIGYLPEEEATMAEEVAKILGLLQGSGLFNYHEEIAADTLSRMLRKHCTTKSVVPKVNVLNARPEALRREAEIIAQAGLPGAITVATAVAGRGTDILLGGNPKGLLLLTLRHFFLPILASNAADLSDWRFGSPLVGLPEGIAFRSPDDMRYYMPAALVESFENALQACQDFVNDETHKQFVALGFSSALEMIVEETEIDRSHFLLAASRNGYSLSLESALIWLRKVLYCKDIEEKSSETINIPVARCFDLIPQHTSNKLREYALLQWLWFDVQCEKYAKVVCESGGLEVIVTSLQESRRVLQQLRGRAGRQGNPGETILVSSLEDELFQFPSFASLFSLVKSSIPEDAQLEPLDFSSVDRLVIQAEEMVEQMHRQGRESTRKYDTVLESYRRHVYRLRRIIIAGGEAARAILIHYYVRKLAVELVSAHLDSNRSPEHWMLSDLLKVIKLAVNPSTEDLDKVVVDRKLSKGNDSLDLDLKQIQMKDQTSDKAMPAVATFVYDNGQHMGLYIHIDEEIVSKSVLRALQENSAFPEVSLPTYSVPPFRREAWQLISSTENQMYYALHGQKRSGKYMEQVKRLEDWVTELLQNILEVRRKSILETAPTAFGNELQCVGSLRLVERNSLLTVLDSLWADFLHDATNLERATATRAFSMFDPVDEFRLEVSHLFAQMLTNFRREAALVSLGPIVKAEWEVYSHVSRHSLHESSFTTRENDSSMSDLNNLTNSVELEWTVDWLEENCCGGPNFEILAATDSSESPRRNENAFRDGNAYLKPGSLTLQDSSDEHTGSMISNKELDNLAWTLTNAFLQASPDEISEFKEKLEQAKKDHE